MKKEGEERGRGGEHTTRHMQHSRYCLLRLNRACDDTQIYILRSLSHPNLIRLHDIPQPHDARSFEDLYLVFEFVDTDMYKLIQSPQYVLTWVIGGVRGGVLQNNIFIFIHRTRITHTPILTPPPPTVAPKVPVHSTCSDASISGPSRVYFSKFQV